MPDHVLEALLAGEGGPAEGLLVVAERAESSLLAATAAMKAGTAASWGTRVGFALVDERGDDQQVLLRFRWGESLAPPEGTQHGEPALRWRLRRLSLHAGKVISQSLELPAGASDDEGSARWLETMRCTLRGR